MRNGVLSQDDVPSLRCPECGEGLSWSGGRLLLEGELACDGCHAAWPVRHGMPRLYREPWITGTDRLMRRFYDGLPRLHDPTVRFLLPLMQGGTEASLRAGYMGRLELAELAAETDGRPARILEVGVGAGANLPLVRAGLPPGKTVEYWGLDLSWGMLSVLRRKLERSGDYDVRLIMGDAHQLPFPDSSFDRVFHVGGIGGFRDPAAALVEMARIARPGTPIVVADEQLDPSEPQSLYHRAMFRLLTFYDPRPHSPTEALPDGATDVLSEQVSRFYYSLRFRVP